MNVETTNTAKKSKLFIKTALIPFNTSLIRLLLYKTSLITERIIIDKYMNKPTNIGFIISIIILPFQTDISVSTISNRKINLSPS